MTVRDAIIQLAGYNMDAEFCIWDADAGGTMEVCYIEPCLDTDNAKTDSVVAVFPK
jgi:hypothetical protein